MRIQDSTLSFFLGFSILSLLLFSANAGAQTLPYAIEVDSFSVPERGLFDGFSDGSINPNWTGVIGNVSESGSTLNLASPGQGGFLPPGVISESTVLSGMGTAIDGFGDFTATTSWLPVAPTESQSFNFSLGSINSATGNVHQLSIGLGETSQGVADALGGGAGLTVSLLSVVRDSGPGNILSFERTSVLVSAGDISGRILLSLVFDDAQNLLTPQVSLDNGVTTLTPFAGTDWAFQGGGFSLSAGSTVAVPEPSTALLIGLGLVGLGRRGRSRRGDSL